MSLTEAQLSEKRRQHTLERREKKRLRYQRHGLNAQDRVWKRDNAKSWLSMLGETHKEAEKRARLEQMALVESRIAKAAMPKPGKKGLISRIKSFFGKGR